MTLLDVCTWLDQTRIAVLIRDSNVLFPIIESVHLMALGLLGGMVLLVDLRLCGIGLTTRDASEVDAHTRRWYRTALVTIVVTGLLLFVSEAVKCYESVPFWIKIGSLVAVLVLRSTVRARALRLDYVRTRPMLTRSIGMLSMLLWFGVAWGGRWIGFGG